MEVPGWARYALVISSALILQVHIVSNLRVQHVAADLLLLLAVAGGLVTGPQRGAIIGFSCGLALDTVLPTPLGLAALAYCLTGYACGLVEGGILRAARWINIVAAAGASAAGVLVFAAVGEVLGEGLLSTPDLWLVVAIVAALNALLSPAAVRVVRWADDSHGLV